MSKSYYLAADGGGTKLQTILYDEDLRVIRTGRVAGVNTLFKPRTWCSFCPMGTMTQMICKVKAGEKL